MPVDYSKWDHIEISDDEDETHPNVHTPSLFRWRHEARLERMAKAKQEKEEFKKGYAELQQKLNDTQGKLKNTPQVPGADVTATEEQLKELKLQEEHYRKKEEELMRKERLTPLNIDTICRDGKDKTVINKAAPPKKKNLTEEEQLQRQQQFVAENEPLLKKFGMFRKYNDTQEFLSNHSHLVCEETANYLMLWCIDLQQKKKKALMDHVAHQAVLMQFILDIARNEGLDPHTCVGPFLNRMKTNDKDVIDVFNEELSLFKGRAQVCAEARLDRAKREEEDEILVPDDLDPEEVFESLPEAMKECLRKQETHLLSQVIGEMDIEVARHHIERCIASGLIMPKEGSDQQPIEPESSLGTEQLSNTADHNQPHKDDMNGCGEGQAIQGAQATMPPSLM